MYWTTQISQGSWPQQPTQQTPDQIEEGTWVQAVSTRTEYSMCPGVSKNSGVNKAMSTHLPQPIRDTSDKDPYPETKTPTQRPVEPTLHAPGHPPSGQPSPLPLQQSLSRWFRVTPVEINGVRLSTYFFSTVEKYFP